tara:strand:- start:7987 stop:9636 length:1650 start_codon:yes stop_codon:yes gene_type:complete
MNGTNLIKKYDSMSSNVIGNWLNLWQECADFCFPSNDNINRIRIAGQEKPPQRMIDTCIEANYNFASGFFSHMFPPNTVWAKFRHPSPKVMQNKVVANYFEEVSRIAHQVMISSNFAQEEFQALLSLGCFGTNCLSVEEDDKNIIKFRNYTIDTVRIAENHLHEVDTIAREYELTSKQALQKFGSDALKKAKLEYILNDIEHSRDTKYKFIQCVMPRLDYKFGSLKSKDKPFASYHVSRNSKEIVMESGFDFNPFKVSRFMTGNEEVYGRSPMSMCLGTARRTNVVYRSMIVAAEHHANPQWLIPDDDSVSGMSSRAGSFIKWRATNPMGKPERLQPNGNPSLAKEIFDLHEAQIRKQFFNHLFRPLDQYRNMTATEVNERMTTDLMTLTPFVSRYIAEHVTPLMTHVYYILQKRNQLPPIPQELAESPDYEVDYLGRLSLASKSFETMGAINTLRIFGELSQMNPDMLQSLENVDPDQLFREIWFANSSSMNALKDPIEVDEEREEKAEMAAQMQAIQAAPALADAAQKVSGSIQPDSILAQEVEGGQ